VADLGPKRERLAPHPVLAEYFTDEVSRRQTVDAMFDASAPHYDAITSMMSFGSGRWYRSDALKRQNCGPGDHVLDVGAGTGAVSLIAQELVGNQGLVVALDPSRGMLAEAVGAGVARAILGFGEHLPFPDNTFDLVTMGYALRHVADLRLAFEEYLRVLKPGGRVLLLEISRPEGRLSLSLLKFYMQAIVPNLARLLSRSRDAKRLMEYYWDTIETCVAPGRIVDALGEAGFSDTHRHVVFGIFSEYSASKQ